MEYALLLETLTQWRFLTRARILVMPKVDRGRNISAAPANETRWGFISADREIQLAAAVASCFPDSIKYVCFFEFPDIEYTVVKVTRNLPSRGELTIADGENVMHRKEVLLSFDALFGPDVADVASWQEASITIVDKLQQS